MKNSLLSIILLLFAVNSLAQHPNKLVRKGNSSYTDSLYSEAEQQYRKALMKDQNSFAASFNLADAIYKQEKYSESTSLFKALSEKSENKIEKSKSYHNLGNSLIKEQKIDDAIEAYKNALRNNPNDLETKHNLAYAQRMKNQQQKQEEEKEDQQEEDKKDEEEEEEEEKEEEKQEEEKEENNQEQNENSEEQSKEEPQKPQDPNEMTEDEAEQILDALQQQEKELQEDLQKKKNKGVKLKILKDW